MTNQLDNTYFGTIVTLVSGIASLTNVEIEAKFIFMTTSIISCTMSAIYTYHKIKKIRSDENDMD